LKSSRVLTEFHPTYRLGAEPSLFVAQRPFQAIYQE